MDMEWLVEEYGSIGDEAAEVEAALPFIGFSSMEEFIGVFRGTSVLPSPRLNSTSTASPKAVPASWQYH